MCKKIFAFFVLALIGISHAGIITSPISPKMNFISPKTHPKLYKEVETPQPPPTIFARKVQWGIDNMVTADGWSLTGYSSTDKDSEGRYARWKFGFIGGDCAASEMLVAPTISLDEDLNVEAAQLTKTQWIMDRLPFIVVVIILSLIVAMMMKSRLL